MSDISFFDSAFGIISAFVVFLLGGVILTSLSNVFFASKVRVLALYIWHSLFCLAYAYVTTIMISDAVTYYFDSLGELHSFRLGTVPVDYFTSIFTKYIGLSYLGTFLVFNVLGSIGLIAVDAALRQATFDKPKFVKNLALVVVLLPSMSFWTGSIGKDSIAFMAVGLALWAALNTNKRFMMMAVAVVVMLLVRPHIAGLMVLSLVCSFMLSGGLSIVRKIFFSSFAMVGVLLITPIMFSYIGLGEIVTVERVQENIERRQSYNQEGGGGLDISSMTLPEQVFSYIFRPLPYEAHSIFSFISSLDNTILLIVFLFFLKSYLKLRRRNVLYFSAENRAFIIIFSLVTLVVLSMVTANMGIAVRQKWMVMPFLLYLMFSYTSISLRVRK